MTLGSIAQHAHKHGITALKKYSQNFIFDYNLCEKIVRNSGLTKNDIALEIGPGIAGLTRAILATKPKSLTVIETDSRCIPLLEEIKELFPNLHIIQGNALKLDLSSLGNQKVNIISNLPYQIGTELVIKCLKQSFLVNSMTLMLQKEVVERICSPISTKSYGRLSVICQLFYYTQKCFNVTPKSFYPPPKVHSSIIKLIPIENDFNTALIKTIELVTKFAFAERRKMIKSSLKRLTPNIENFLKELNIDSSCRAENLSPQDYLKLAKLYSIYNKDVDKNKKQSI